MTGIDFIFAIIILLMSVVIHEVAHGYAAEALGDPTARLQGRLTLNPIKHLDIFGSIIIPAILVITKAGFLFGWAKPVPYNPYNLRNQRWGEALVAGAGPAVNIIIAIIFGLIIRAGIVLGASPAFIGIASLIVFINIILALFNLVPIPPLDGSKILFAFLPLSARRYMYVLEQFGLIIVILFVFTFWKFLTPVLGLLFSFLTGIAF